MLKALDGVQLSLPVHRLAAAVTPLLWKTYEEQLQLKHSSMEDFLRKAVKAIQKRDADPVGTMDCKSLFTNNKYTN